MLKFQSTPGAGIARVGTHVDRFLVACGVWVLLGCGDIAGEGATTTGAAEGDVLLTEDAGGATSGDGVDGSAAVDGASGVDGVDTADGADSTDSSDGTIDPIIWDDELKDGWIEPDVGECDSATVRAYLQYTPDGDTVHLTNGERVRLLGVAASEVSGNECYSNEAKESLIALAPKGTEVCLIPDPNADNKDVYDRLLRYMFVPHKDDGRWVLANARMVRIGHARAYTSFLWGLRFRNDIVAAEFDARTEDIGGWAACGWAPR